MAVLICDRELEMDTSMDFADAGPLIEHVTTQAETVA